MRVKEDAPELEPQGTTLPELVRELKHWKQQKTDAEASSEAAGKMIHKIAVLRIPQLMENLALDEFNAPGVGRVELDIEVYPNLTKPNVPAFYAWLRERGDGDIVQETIHHKTLQAFVKELLASGEKLPDCITAAKIPTAKLLAERKRKKSASGAEG